MYSPNKKSEIKKLNYNHYSSSNSPRPMTRDKHPQYLPRTTADNDFPHLQRANIPQRIKFLRTKDNINRTKSIKKLSMLTFAEKKSKIKKTDDKRTENERKQETPPPNNTSNSSICITLLRKFSQTYQIITTKPVTKIKTKPEIKTKANFNLRYLPHLPDTSNTNDKNPRCTHPKPNLQNPIKNQSTYTHHSVHLPRIIANNPSWKKRKYKGLSTKSENDPAKLMHNTHAHSNYHKNPINFLQEITESIDTDMDPSKSLPFNPFRNLSSIEQTYSKRCDKNVEETKMSKKVIATTENQIKKNEINKSKTNPSPTAHGKENSNPTSHHSGNKTHFCQINISPETKDKRSYVIKLRIILTKSNNHSTNNSYSCFETRDANPISKTKVNRTKPVVRHRVKTNSIKPSKIGTNRRKQPYRVPSITINKKLARRRKQKRIPKINSKAPSCIRHSLGIVTKTCLSLGRKGCKHHKEYG